MASDAMAFVSARPSNAKGLASNVAPMPSLAMPAMVSQASSWATFMLELAAFVAMCVTLRWKKKKHLRWIRHMRRCCRVSHMTAAMQQSFLMPWTEELPGSSPDHKLHEFNQPLVQLLEQPAAISREVSENFDPLGTGTDSGIVSVIPNALLRMSVVTQGAIEDQLGMPDHEIIKIVADVVKDIDSDLSDNVGLQQCLTDVFSDVVMDMYGPA
eukprot:TRINITY_DN65031_c0_g1_i1.p1 TRINITY_DN65031_c0_g1~~TRINITY_DN65031_c0_g1_i1.p1  ORF type:complete len:213 (-),score=24.33 TRINITY_DN65031_c0_g1_i1:222-860(-)